MTIKSPVIPGRYGENVNVSPGERMLSVFAGGVLTSWALRRGDWNAAALAAPAGLLLWRGFSGQCPAYRALRMNTAVEQHKGQHTRRVITINKSPEEVYSFWRNFENLIGVMQNLESVRVMENGRSVWRARGPAGKVIEWEAEITKDVPNERIEWRSLPGASVPNAGFVAFQPTPGSGATVVEVVVDYEPPAGTLGVSIAKLMGSTPGQEIDEDLRRLKQRLETGEVPTTKGQPSGRGIDD
jgi:uncharacterized membrane protein